MLLGLKKVGKIPWEVEVASLTPLWWAKFNEPNATVFLANGNFGSATVSSWAIASGATTFGSTPIMPSDLTRTTILQDTTHAYPFSIAGSSPTFNDATNTIYFAAKLPGTGFPALIAWRSGSGGVDFARFDGTFMVVRVRGIDVTTTVTNASVLNNVGHLIGITFTAASVSVWVDGVKAFTGSVAGSSTATAQFTYMQNGGLNQRLFGNFGDFIVWNRVLTDPENMDLYTAWS